MPKLRNLILNRLAVKNCSFKVCYSPAHVFNKSHWTQLFRTFSQFAGDFLNLTGGYQIKVVQIHKVKQKIPFQVSFFEFLAVFVDKGTASVDNLEIGDVAGKEKKTSVGVIKIGTGVLKTRGNYFSQSGRKCRHLSQSYTKARIHVIFPARSARYTLWSIYMYCTFWGDVISNMAIFITYLNEETDTRQK